MHRIMLKSKIHRATVTEANPDYPGSVTIDSNLMKAADILPSEQVHVLDVDNGARLVTYAIEGDPGSGTVQMNGAAATVVERGHVVIIASYGEYDDTEMAAFEPKVVLVDAKNNSV